MKIVGYRFMRPDLKEVAMVILEIGNEKTLYNNLVNVQGNHSHYCFNIDSIFAKRAEDAGILDSWFEPVYTRCDDTPELNYLPNTWHVDSKNTQNVIYHKENGIAWGRIDGHWIKSDNIYSIAKYIIWKPINSDGRIVGDMLLRQAKELGLTSGARVLNGKYKYELIGDLDFEPKQGTLLCHIKNDSGGRLLLMGEGVWVKKIEEPKIKDYTWYRLNAYDKTLIFHTTGNKGYGLNHKGIWEPMAKDYTFTDTPEEWTEVSIRYLTERLTTYAMSKGYIKNNEFIRWDPSTNTMICFCQLNNLTHVILNDKGEWFDDKCIVNGYEATISGGYIKFGCAELNLSWFDETFNRSIKELTLNSGVVLRENDMKSIRAFYKKNKKERDNINYGKTMHQRWKNINDKIKLTNNNNNRWPI